MSGMIRLSWRKWLLPNCCHEESGIVDQASSHECRRSGPLPWAGYGRFYEIPLCEIKQLPITETIKNKINAAEWLFFTSQAPVAECLGRHRKGPAPVDCRNRQENRRNGPILRI